MTLARQEVQLAVIGALRLACGDARGMRYFDTSLDGFWRSFRAAALCYPLYLILLGFRVTDAEWAQSGVATIVLVETIAYVISWVAFPLLIMPLTRAFGRPERFLGFMVAYNWSQLPQTALLLFIGLNRVTGLLPTPGSEFAELVGTCAIIVYEWYIARVALSVTGMQAVLVVLVDLVLAAVLGQITEGLY